MPPFEQTLTSSAYVFTITDQVDPDYLKYLTRKVRPYQPTITTRLGTRIDISLDDPEGDIVAGIAALTVDDTLFIDVIWVEASLRKRGIARQLIRMTEEIALGRSCHQAEVTYAPEPLFYQKLGYTISGKLTQFQTGQRFFRLQKTLVAPIRSDFSLEELLA
ncbi:MAG: GNAT family N-acetyltransferase [Anaerolineae bacterium]|jgi:GNAT superfamily N-acetyltransferase|nr:GNAT family N-acetyltransferase [Anaerolineae bacterium]